MSLRSGLTFFVITLSTLAISAGIALVLLTTHLHRATIDMENGLQSVRLAEELQIDLLNYARPHDSAERRSIESELRQKVAAARQYVNTPEEDKALTEAGEFLNRHLSPSDQLSESANDQDLQKTFSALRRFVDINVEQANASLKESARWDDLGDRIGVGVAAALLAGTAVILVWLRVVAFQPIFHIRHVMRKFAGGDKTARVPVNGPEELRSIAAQFNEMADALARQHQNEAAFLAAVAHDLRNPLSALTASADLLTNHTFTPERLASLMGVVKRQVNSLDRMIGDLLDSSKIESGQLELRLETCDARTIAEDVFSLFSAASNTHQFKLRMPETPAPVLCDRLRIEQVLNNLISNAIKYSPAGGEIRLSLTWSLQEAVFEVSDEGIGIAGHEIPYIFEPFRRVRTAKEEIPGVGLGLAVARRIVVAHGGRIDVESAVGTGTRFFVRLPALASHRASA